MAESPLHGRDSEVGRLTEAVMALAAGQGCVVVVGGAVGVGKSRLVHEAAGWARHLGLAVAAGDAVELHRLSSLAPLLSALRDSTPPIIGPADFEPVEMLAADRSRLVDRLHVALERMAGERPVLVALDDLQWADPLTLVVVGSLTERLADKPVMWLLSRRRWPSTSLLDKVVADLVDSGAVEFELAPLPPDTVATMAGELLGAPPDEVLLALLEKCSGNPFMVTKLLSTLVEHQELVVDTTHARLLPGGPPGNLYQPLIGWLNPVSPPTRQLLEVAAVFGRFFEVASVAQVLRCAVAELLPSVQEALEADLVAEDGVRLGFRHELVRDAVYSAIPLTARRALHREAAYALLATGGSTVDAAAHITRGAYADADADAVAVLVRASKEVAATAPGTAADLRLRAVELMPADDAVRARLIAESVGLLLRAHRGAEAEAFAELVLRGDLPAEVEALVRLQLAETLGFTGRPASALHHARAALGLAGVDDAVRAQLYAVESHAHVVTGESGAALRAGEQALGAGTAPPDATAAGRALLSMSAAERMRGRLTRSLELVDEAVRLMAPDPAQTRRLRPQWTRGRTLMALDRFDEATAAFETAGGSTGLFAYICRATLLLQRGEIAGAIAEADAGLDRAAELESWTHVPELCAVLAEACAYRGQFGLARSQLRRGRNLVGEPGSVAAQRLAWATAVVDATAGEDPARLLSHLAPLYDELPDRLPALALDPMVGPRLVDAARRADDPGRAAAAAEATEFLGQQNDGVVSFTAAGLQAGGLLDDDADRLVAAASAFQASPRPLARAWACEDAARSLLRHNRRTQAVHHLERAAADYGRAGALAPARRVRDRLTAVGTGRAERSVVHRPAFGWESLTEAELRVARLAATGLTNRDIAEDLELSPHTVESHLRHAFHKLDVRSRVELTRIVLTRDDRSPG
ncbi:MAG: ATP-binding protein [Kribbellaceae bacterium]